MSIGQGTTIVAFRVGLKAAAESGFVLAAAHTDSPVT